MEYLEKPKFELATKVLPPPLFKALVYLFEQGLTDVVLVGGTALSGFYFAHRRSDDIDLFAKDELNHKAAVAACKSLKNIGVDLTNEFHTNQYYRANSFFEGHKFIIDIVVDENIFRVCESFRVEKGINVLSLNSLFMTKAACLVSRCSEKDIYDLIHICQVLGKNSIADLIELGKKIDGGVNPESLILSIGGATLNESSCNFSLKGESAKKVFKEISIFRKELLKQLNLYIKRQKASPLKEIVDRIKKFDRKS